jgi:MYXO-CTERM domain-containing protein
MMQHSGRKLLAALFAASCLCAPIQAAVTQWRVEDGGNGHYYDIIVTPKQSWYAMRDQAFALGGYLASIRSAEENSWIWSAFSIGATEAYWADYYDGPVFGGFRLNYANPWTWVSGEEWGYSNFGWSSNDGPHGTQFIAHSPTWDDLPALGGGAGGNVAMIVEWDSNPVPAPAAAPLLALAGLLGNRRRRS